MAELRRKTLLSAVESKDAFLKFVNPLMAEYGVKSLNNKLQRRARCVTNQAEVIQELSQRQTDQLWKDVYRLCVDTLKYICNALNNNEPLGEDIDISSLLHDSILILEGVCLLMLGSLESDTPTITEEATQTAFLLHGSLLDLYEVDKMLSFDICMVCVKWWERDLRSKEEVCLNAIVVLLKLFASKFMPNLLDSIFQIQDCLKLFSYKANNQQPETTQNIELLKQLLVPCFSYLEMLKTTKGRKFLSLVLLLDEELMKTIHKSILENIKHSFPISKAEALGRLYHASWRTADDDVKRTFEEICIQDLMYSAVHAPRVKGNNIFTSQRNMLGSIISRKGSTEVRHMITRLYTPIIWRSLKSINPVVRANSADLFLDAFPLEEERVKESTTEHSNYMNKQFTAINNMLMDPVPRIRREGIIGLCKIFHMYWDVISAEVIAAFFKKLYGELALDSSVNVRQAVYEGTISLLDTPCAHEPLSNILPVCLPKGIQDTSEKVRIAAADVLLAVKQTSSISFWKVVPITNILAQLETDGGPVSRRLIKLICQSFVPPDLFGQTWVKRCVNFYERNTGAARKFYEAVGNHILFDKAGEFLKEISINIHDVSTKLLGKTNRSLPSLPSDDSTATSDDDSEERFRNNGLPVTEETLVTLTETACLLWKWFYDTCNTLKLSKEQIQLTKKITVMFSRSLLIGVKAAGEERTLNAIILLFSCFPQKCSPTFSQSVLPKLRSLPETSSFHLYSMFINCMCRWNQKNEVLELISEWLSEATKDFAASETGKHPNANEKPQVPAKPARRSARLSKQGTSSGKPAKTSKSVKFSGIQHECRPAQALKYLDCLFEIRSNSVSLEALGNPRCTKLLSSILTSLEQCQGEIAKRLSSASVPNDLWPDKLLISAVGFYCKMLSICYLKRKSFGEIEEGSVDECSHLQKIKHFFSWFENDVLIAYRKQKTQAHYHTFPLGLSTPQVISNLVLYRSLFNMVLSQCSNFLCCSIPVYDQVKETLLLFAESGVNLTEYCRLTLKVMYRIHRHNLLQIYSRQEEPGETALENPATDSTNTDDKFVRVYDVLLTALLQLARRDVDNFLQVFKKEVRADLRLIHQEQFLASCHGSVCYDVLANKSIAAVLADLYHETTSSARFTCRDRLADLPPFSANILPVVCGTKQECAYVCKQTIYCLMQDEKTFTIGNRESVIHSFSHLLYTLCKDSKNTKAAAHVTDQICQSVPDFQQIYTNIEQTTSTARSASEDESNKENSTRVPLLEQQSLLEDNEMF